MTIATGYPKFTMTAPHPFESAPSSLKVWNHQQHDILQTLTRRVRVLTLKQVQQLWCPDDNNLDSIQDDLRRLTGAGLLNRFVINAQPMCRRRKPVFTWQPEAPAPDCKRASQIFRSRWNRASVATEVYVAAKRAANLFGTASCGLPPLEHRDHDLLLSEVYVTYRRHHRSDAECWVGEDCVSKAGYLLKDPDAYLVNAQGLTYRIVESAGRYNTKQVASLHDYCESLAMPYELW